MPPNLGGFFMVRSYYPSECHADYFDFERIEALKPAIEACGISTLSQSPMLGFHKQMDNRIKLLEEILSFRMQGVEFEGLTKRSAVGFLLRSLIMFQTFISRHNSNFFSDKLVLTSVTPASSAPVLQTPKATSSTLYFDSLTVNAGNGGFLHCIQKDTSVNAANQVVSVGADIALDAAPKFLACLVRFESSSVPTTLPTAYDVYPLDGRHDGRYYTVKDCVTIDVLPRTPGNNVYVGFMVWSNFTATKCRGLVSLNQVIKEIICLQPLK